MDRLRELTESKIYERHDLCTEFPHYQRRTLGKTVYSK